MNKLKLLFNRYFWHDVEYFIKKILRFPYRIYKWSGILFNYEYWSDTSVLKLLRFSLEELKQCNLKDKWYVNSRKRAKEISIIINHIDRYFDIDKYTIDNDVDEFLNNRKWKELENGYYEREIIDKELDKKHTKVILHQQALEEWHYSEIFRRLRKLRHWGL